MVRNCISSSFFSVCLSLLLSSFASAQVIVSDGDFSPANWQTHIYYQDTGTDVSATTTEPSGGNPGAHREMTLQWNTGGGTAAIYVFYEYKGASYDPSVQGAISSINYSQDGRISSDSHGAASVTLPARMGLIQNGTIYRSRVASTIQSSPFPGPWANLTLDNLTASNFPKAVETDPGPDRPDFSATGSEIFFGYVCAGSTGIAVREIGIGIDNWSVTANQQADATYTINKVVHNDADVEISSAEVGDSVIYRITLANTGGVDLSGVVVTDALPDNLQFNSATATPANAGISYASGTVTWPVGTVATSESASMDINVTILSGSDQQTLTNEAEVTAIDAPGVAGQTASVDLAVHSQEADLEFVLITSENLGDVGGGVYKTRVTSTVRNNGPDAAEGVVVIYDYPQTLESPEVVMTGDPINDLMVCEDRPAQRDFYCELPVPNLFNAGVTVDLVVDYVRTGNTTSPEVTMTATTDDPYPANNDYNLPPVDSGTQGFGGCFISEMMP